MAALHPPGWVANSVRSGLSAREGLRQYREAGGSIRDAVWYRLYAEQRTAVDSVKDEMTRPLDATPRANEITRMTTKRATGYLQTLDIYTRVKGTDVVTVRPFMFTTSTLMTRGDALSNALTMMQQAVDEDRYEEVLLGGVYTGTRRMTPGDVT